MAGKQRISITKEYLIEEYINKKRSMTDISHDVGCGYGSINRFIKLFNICPRTNGEHKKVDITGKTFGDWTAIKEASPAASGHTKWFCICKCGKELEIEHNALASRKSYPRRRCADCACKKKRINGRLTKTFWGQIKRGAKKRNLSFNITKDFAESLLLKQNKKCDLSGMDIIIADTARNHNHGKTTASLDRINSKKGYLEDNIQWVHKDVNLIKGALNQEIFISLCKSIANYIHKETTCQYEENKIKKSNWNGLIRRANHKFYKFDISMDYAWKLFLKQGKKCAISGIDLHFPKNTYTFQKYNDGNISLDRIDSQKGYLKDNVQWVYKKVNIMKLDYEINYFLELCKKINNHCS